MTETVSLSHLVYVSDVDVDVCGAQQPDSQVCVEGPEGARGAGVSSAGAGAGLRRAPAVRRSHEPAGGKLTVQTVLADQHQVRQTGQRDAAPDVLNTHRRRQRSRATDVTEQRLTHTLYWLRGYFSRKYSSHPHTLRMYWP